MQLARPVVSSVQCVRLVKVIFLSVYYSSDSDRSLLLIIRYSPRSTTHVVGRFS